MRPKKKAIFVIDMDCSPFTDTIDIVYSICNVWNGKTERYEGGSG